MLVCYLLFDDILLGIFLCPWMKLCPSYFQSQPIIKPAYRHLCEVSFFHTHARTPLSSELESASSKTRFHSGPSKLYIEFWLSIL